jgi:hypothetical protein
MTPIRIVLNWLVTSTIPLLLLSVGLNVILASRVLVLDRTIAALTAETQLQAGVTVDAFEARSADGTPVRVSFAGSSLPTVLYVMRPTCVWCQRNEANVRSLIEQAPGKYQFVMLSIEDAGVESYRLEKEVPIPILTGIPQSAREEFLMGGTPQTIVISPAGVVLHNWMGYYSSRTSTQIESALKVTLPGLPATGSS